jgi:glycosyltransferase involved in cell wall biosynthesis
MMQTDASPMVTVGMPVYNGEPWLAAAIDSILDQTFRDFVLLLSDNASTDKTQSICESYAARDPRVKYLRSPTNIGLFRNYDRVFALSSTKYFKWASSNDICKARFLESCVDVLESRPDAVLAYPRTALFDKAIEQANLYEERLELQADGPADRFRALLNNLRLNNLINGVIRSNILRETALNKVYTASDTNLVAELVLRGKCIEVPETLFFRRMSPDTSSIMVAESERAEYFAHEPRDVFALQQWKVELGFFAGLWQAPISLAEKCKALRLLLRRLYYNKAKLGGELLTAARTAIRGPKKHREAG